jgi:hypothetical protein
MVRMVGQGLLDELLGPNRLPVGKKTGELGGGTGETWIEKKGFFVVEYGLGKVSLIAQNLGDPKVQIAVLGFDEKRIAKLEDRRRGTGVLRERQEFGPGHVRIDALPTGVTGSPAEPGKDYDQGSRERACPASSPGRPHLEA